MSSVTLLTAPGAHAISYTGYQNVYQGYCFAAYPPVTPTVAYQNCDSSGTTWARIPINTGSAPNSYYQIQIASHPDQCLAVTGGSKVRGAQVIVWSCAAVSPDQFWKLNSTNAGLVFINKNSQMALSVAGGGSQGLGAKLVQWPYSYTRDQYWGLY